MGGTRTGEHERPWRFTLYIAGMRPASRLALSNVNILRECLGGRLELTVVDVYQQPNLARAHDIVALPTLVKESPGPAVTLVGNLSNLSRVLLALGVEGPKN